MQVPSAIHRKASSLVRHPSCFYGALGNKPWKEAKKTIGKQSEKESLTANGEIDKNDYNIQIHFVRCSCFFIIDIRLL